MKAAARNLGGCSNTFIAVQGQSLLDSSIYLHVQTVFATHFGFRQSIDFPC